LEAFHVQGNSANADSTVQTHENTYYVHSACTLSLWDEDHFTKKFLLNFQLKKTS